MWYEEENDDAPYFEVRCEKCGTVRRNDDFDCYNCGSSDVSYQGTDAKRWNSYVDRRY